MWIIKIIGVVTQFCIIILALLLIYQFSSRQLYESRIDSVEKRLETKIDQNKTYFNEKITTQQDNVNRYIQLREDRAKLYSSRIDTLYDLYQKDPTPIEQKTSGAAVGAAIAKDTAPVDANMGYIENKINRVDEKVDSNNSKTTSRLEVIEQKLFNIQTSTRAGNVKVIQNNLQTVNNK